MEKSTDVNRLVVDYSDRILSLCSLYVVEEQQNSRKLLLVAIDRQDDLME